ncbi:hypothetical protein [Escherichia coli]|uniref:hypothetical protein n=1 Tax=Escherichia coli TaxID=562 RepID=UPI003DA7C3F6
MLHKDKQEYHEHLFSGVSGLFLSWSVVHPESIVITQEYSDVLVALHSFYRQIMNTESPPALPADIQLQGKLINTWFSPRRRFNNKKHTGWLMINILIINIWCYP